MITFAGLMQRQPKNSASLKKDSMERACVKKNILLGEYFACSLCSLLCFEFIERIISAHVM